MSSQNGDELRCNTPLARRPPFEVRALANCSSVLGLLGTVFGLVNAFLTISGNEFAGAKELSLSVSSYLVCTAFGLLVSLVCQLFHGVLSCMLDRQLHEMSKGAAEITFFLTHNPPPGNA